VGRQRQPPKWVEKHSEPEKTINTIPDSAGLTEDAGQPPSSKGLNSNISPRPSLMERAMSKIMPKSDDVLGTPFPADSNGGLEDPATTLSGANTDFSSQKAPRLTEHTTEPVHGHLDLDVIRQPLGSVVSRLSNTDEKTLQAWNRYSLVRQRCFTAQEAVTLVDL
jgi:hypothetical protein